MPFYEYSCRKCGSKFDLLRRLAERDNPADCPSCGANDVHRELSKVSASVRSGSPPCDAGSCGKQSFG